MKKNMLVSAALCVCLLFASTCVAAAAEKAKAKAKEGILLVAFGTSEPDARGAIQRIVDGVKKAFPGADVRLSFTSNIIRRKVLKEEGLAFDSPLIALAKMQDDGVVSVTVQSLHIIPGEEYNQLAAVVRSLRSIEGKYAFASLNFGSPLLETYEDYEKAVALLKTKYGALAGNGAAVVFMGHGTHHSANSAYAQMQLLFDDAKLPFVIGTVEGYPSLDTVKRRLADLKPSKVTLVPFMIVAGDHAKNDMSAKDDPESWLSILSKEGYAVETLLKGLGDGDGLAELFVEHIREAARK